MTANESLLKYLEALSTSYEELASASSKASDRGAKLSKQLTEEVVAGQREAISLAKQIAADPDHLMTASVSAVTEAAVAAQTRALAFAQMAYQEAVVASTEGRSAAERIAKANQATADAAIELSKSWAAFNPMAELFVRTSESMMQAAGLQPKS